MIGTGTALKQLIRDRLGIDACEACNHHVELMNQNGPDWCGRNMDLVCQWLKHECRARGIPFVKFVASGFVAEAIRISRESV